MKNMYAQLVWILAFLLCQVGHACPNAICQAEVRQEQTSLTLRLDLDEPLDNAVTAFRVRVTDRLGSVELIPELNQSRHSGIHEFHLNAIPVEAITVLLEGLDANGDVVAFFVQDVDLTDDSGTLIATRLIPRVESIEDLGHGFRCVTIQKPTSFEIGHFAYLYYGEQKLCDLGLFSVSNSGGFAVFQDANSGNLFLFRRADGRQTQLTRRFVALVDKFEWDENAGMVRVYFSNGLSESYSVHSYP